MRKLVPLVLGSFLFAGSLLAQEVGDKMPLLLDKNFMFSRGMNGSGKSLSVDYYDRNADGKFHELAISLICNGEKDKFPFEIFYRRENKSFVDNNPTDGTIDKIVPDSVGYSYFYNAPDCP